ncbi:GNAT family N-acetyltransferase [Nocardia sp. NPDC049526]|uniref:GNAT family N-acetyltransferase n=1 Tax=Nocardia sp. NPDC049526 TaxID=3364316 RepID=UPI0037B84E0A
MTSRLVEDRATCVVRRVEAVADISRASWDALVAPGDLYTSYAWVRHLEDVLGPAPVLACQSNGEVVGVLPLWDGESGRQGLFHLPDFFPGLDGLWSQRYRWLGARRATHNTLASTTGAERTTVLRMLLSAAIDGATDDGLAGVIMPYLPLMSAVELGAAHPDARVLVHSAEAVVTVPSDGWHELGQRASSHNRKLRRHELRDFARHGLAVEYTELTDSVAEESAMLIAQTRHKHGSRDGVDWMRDVFAAQRRAGLLDRAVAISCRRAGKLAAVAICYPHGDRLHGRYFGADYAQSRRANAYFVATFHAPLHHAVSAGFRQVDLSISSLEAKVRRGATLEPLAAVVLTDDKRLPSRDAVAAHNLRVAASYRERFSTYPWSLSPTWPITTL